MAVSDKELLFKVLQNQKLINRRLVRMETRLCQLMEANGVHPRDVTDLDSYNL